MTDKEALLLSSKLVNDSQKCIYSSLLSMADAINGIENKFRTWPVIKLYYSCFYAIRALLALNNICIYYDGKLGYWIRCSRGALPTRSPKGAGGSTHKFAFMLYEDEFSSSPILSQPIDNISPFQWLMSRREEANYKIARFIEPADSQWLMFTKRRTIRQLCNDYIDNDHYAFDPDHAILAYPIYVLKHIEKIGVRGCSCLDDSSEDSNYEAYFRSKHGPISSLIGLKRKLVVS